MVSGPPCAYLHKNSINCPHVSWSIEVYLLCWIRSKILTLEEVWSSWTRPSGRAMMVMPISLSRPMWRLFPAWNSDARSFLLKVLREGQTLFTKFFRGRLMVSANSWRPGKRKWAFGHDLAYSTSLSCALSWGSGPWWGNRKYWLRKLLIYLILLLKYFKGTI